LAKAAALYQRACDAGGAVGCFNTGVLHMNSPGPEQRPHHSYAGRQC
jgi:TPR repeat protein